MRYLLAGVLVVAAAGACRAEGGIVKLGMRYDEVRAAMASMIVPGPGIVGLDGSYLDYYYGVDCLGGVTTAWVTFDRGMRATKIEATYHPFSDRPAWLESVWDAFSPRQK